MAESQFMPAAPALALSNNSLDQATGYQNLFARAQEIQQQKQMFPAKLAQATANVALTTTQNQMSQAELSIYEQEHASDIETHKLATQRAEQDATIASSKAKTASYQAFADAMKSLPDDMAAVSAPASPTGTSGSVPWSMSVGKQPSAPDGSDDDAQYMASRMQLYKVAQLSAKYGAILAAHQDDPNAQLIQGRLNLMKNNADYSMQTYALHRSNDFRKTINEAAAAALSDDPAAIDSALQKMTALASNPVFAHAQGLPIGLSEQYKETFDQLKKQKDTNRGVEAEKVKTAQKQVQENTISPSTGYEGVVKQSGMVKPFVDKVTAFQNVKGIVNRLLEINDEASLTDGVLPTALSAEAGALTKSLDAHLASAMFNRTTENELHILSSSVTADPTKWNALSGNTRAKLNAALRVQQSDVDHEAANLGLKKLGTNEVKATVTPAMLQAEIARRKKLSSQPPPPHEKPLTTAQAR